MGDYSGIERMASEGLKKAVCTVSMIAFFMCNFIFILSNWVSLSLLVVYQVF